VILITPADTYHEMQMRLKFLFIITIAVLLMVFNPVESMAGKNNKDEKPVPPSLEDTRPIPTNIWAMRLAEGVDPETMAQKYGLEYVGPVGTLKGFHLFRIPSAKARTFEDQTLRRDPEILWLEQQYERKRFKRLPVDPLFNDQWHLNNSGQSGGTSGMDANVIPAWSSGFLGNGVQIAIVDDGLQHEHPDFQGNYASEDSWNFNDNISDPSPTDSRDNHGTRVGGVAAARDDGSTCGVGAAYRASLSGIRLIAGPITDSMEAQALIYNYHNNHIFNNSWGPFDDGERLDGPGTLTRIALEDGVTNGRDGLGSIYVWAAGNGLLNNDNVNYDGYANSRYTIAVGAVDHNGKQARYSEPGAAMLIAAPSSGDIATITTTDLLLPHGDTCTSSFGGTSSSAPLVSGIIALMLQANPGLSWRDVQHILVNSAVRNDPQDEDWNQNGAGKWINHKYGFGMIDAAQSVNLASTWSGSGSNISRSFDSGVISVNQPIPDDNPAGVLSSFTVSRDLIVEHVEIIFTATHPWRGDLEIGLTSPNGTRSMLAEKRWDSNPDYPGWKFMSVRKWGESSEGTWTLQVTDLWEDFSGTFDSWQLILHGTEPKETGLQVIIEPEKARAEGAQWRRSGTDDWLNSHDTEINVPAGDHIVEFTIIPGWNTQSKENVTIVSKETFKLDVTYCENNTQHSISVSSADSNGTVEGENNYLHNTLVTLKANPEAGYVFSHWTENGLIVKGARATYTFRATSNRNLVAHFRKVNLPGMLHLLLGG
jgi:subtilisin-like proprotein convertase family protein